ncbi:hypothetical protein ANCCAN_06935 [Ancylostoma caninum]|uniref:Uncharacterized protein n=1 Tax=Ancylostoma caninum TaxID=29170 RepID=A0A368GRQ5_ANCCA|nr:hypothetical protein ANCCAN_06935 [Ancylostoma caninum]
MDRAANHILEKKRRGIFNQAVYNLNLVELATKSQPRKKDNTYQRLAALYRFLLMRVTDPPEAVREYSIRLNDKQGYDTRLKSLPEDVENVLIGLGEDMLGFGHDEIIPGTDVDLEESSYYKELGRTEKERKDKLVQLYKGELEWRPHVFKAVQLALRDVRSYGYNKIANKWIPNNRQAKRPAPQIDSDDSPLHNPNAENEDPIHTYAYNAADYGARNFAL